MTKKGIILATMAAALLGISAEAKAAEAAGSDRNAGWHIVVAQDGSGDFTSIQEAIDAAPDYSHENYTRIYIKAGIYREMVTIPHNKFRLHIVGECDKPNLDDLRNTLSERYFELEVYDETTPPRNLWEGIGEDNLRGLFLQKMRAMLDAATDEDEKRKILLAVKYGIDAIENRDF